VNNNNKGFTEQSVEPSSPNTLLDRVSYAKTLWASAFAGHKLPDPKDAFFIRALVINRHERWPRWTFHRELPRNPANRVLELGHREQRYSKRIWKTRDLGIRSRGLI
jgi:hypothetical protein